MAFKSLSRELLIDLWYFCSSDSNFMNLESDILIEKPSALMNSRHRRRSGSRDAYYSARSAFLELGARIFALPFKRV